MNETETETNRYRPAMTVGAPPGQPYRYALGTIVPPGSYNMHHDLTQAEWAELDEAAGAIDQLAPPFHYMLVERNFRQLQDLHRFVSITIALGREFAVPKRKQLVESVMAAATVPPFPLFDLSR